MESFHEHIYNVLIVGLFLAVLVVVAVVFPSSSNIVVHRMREKRLQRMKENIANENSDSNSDAEEEDNVNGNGKNVQTENTSGKGRNRRKKKRGSATK
eukprot:m.25015 g.25015  ORF g.25015 m.25015 type:complete len:98 (+) comp9157_c0_seq1:170-463(+)